MGSPPRVRGKLWPRVIRQVCHGITPACAGKTILEQWAFQVFEDPPPACEGKTRKYVLLLASIWDHPRVYRENDKQRSDVADRLGSPPRMRGKLVLYNPLFSHLGITPACAGKTLRVQRLLTVSRDHPRVCGENQ